MERLGPADSSGSKAINHTEKDSLQEKEIFRSLSAPLTAQWELTSSCNQACIHCYNFWRQDEANHRPPNHSTEFLASKVAEQLIINKVFNVTLTGGEPLLVLNRYYDQLESLRDCGVGIDLNTNLALFNWEYARKLKSLGVSSILTSLMSSNSELNDQLANKKEAFTRIVRGIELALDEGFHVGVSMVVTKSNLEDVFGTAEYVRNLGVTTFAATKASTPINAARFYEHSLNPQEFKLMLNELLNVERELGLQVDTLVAPPLCILDTRELADAFGHKSCSAGKITCTIGFDGLIRPCSQNSCNYGSIIDVGLSRAWQEMQEWRTDKFIPEGCRQCPVAHTCIGGCRAEAYAVNGALDSANPLSNIPTSLFTRDRELTRDKVEKKKFFIFSPRLKFRAEEFGGILFLTPSKWLSVDLDLAHFFQTNKNRAFSYTELAEDLKCNPTSAFYTLSLLEEKRMIV